MILGFSSFAQLDVHVKALKDEEVALALASAQRDKSRRAVAVRDDDGKKRKAKSKASHGVGKLQKVDVSGMAKISSIIDIF